MTRTGQHQRCISRLALVVMFVIAVIGTSAAQAQTFTAINGFTGQNGSIPDGLILDPAGNLYGTAGGGASGAGVVFKLDTSGAETVLYSFTGGADGSSPAGGLIRDSTGNLYGTASEGGLSSCHLGCGLVFKIQP